MCTTAGFQWDFMTQKLDFGDTMDKFLKMLAQYSKVVTKTTRICGTIRKWKGKKTA